MDRPRYTYRASLKSDTSDELINTYLLRPIAGLIVWPLYYTAITPNQVTIASTVAGIAAAFFYLKDVPAMTAVAGLLVTLKDVLDSADGQLARAKQQYSRAGRFLDSIGDFVVDLTVFAAVGWVLYQQSWSISDLLLALVGFIGISLRVSYHVFYHTNYLHLHTLYENNRVTEVVREEDVRGGGVELTLQRIFQVMYGWQDRLMVRIDRWSRVNADGADFVQRWYADKRGLRISGFLGFGTELFVLTVCSVANELRLYLWMNVVVMNAVLVGSVAYRRFVLCRQLSA